MIKKFICVFLCFALLAVCFVACGKNDDTHIVLAIDSEPEYLDPQIVSDPGAENIIANCFEGLVTFDKDGSIIPAAAEKWNVSKDGLTYTFTLRDDLWWRVTSAAGKTIGEDYEKSFDAKLTAKDFAFGIRRALRPETKSPYAAGLMAIKNAAQVNGGTLNESELGVEAKDNITLVITLETPDPDFLLALTTPACMPCSEKFFELTKGRYGLSAQYIICNGPFYLSNWAEKTSITARRNDSYHAKKTETGWQSSDPAKPVSIYFSFNNDQSTRDTKIKDGTYTIAKLTDDQAKALSGGKETVQSFSNGTLSLIFNCADSVFSNDYIRKAVGGTADIDSAAKMLGKDKARGIIPMCAMLGEKPYSLQATEVSVKSLDSQTALQMIKNGMEIIEADTLNVTVLCAKEYENLARMIMQKWQSVFGVAFGVSVETVNSVQLNERLKAGSYQLAIVPIEYSEKTAFNCIARYVSGSRNNIVNLNSQSFDEILSGFTLANSVSEKAESLKKAEQYLIDNSIMLPIVEHSTIIAIAKNTAGIVFTPSGSIAYFKNAQ